MTTIPFEPDEPDPSDRDREPTNNFSAIVRVSVNEEEINEKRKN
jgi:hypothetical protein